MSVCSSILSAGLNQDCSAAMAEIKNILIVDKSVKFSYSDKETLSNWTAKVKQELTIAVIPGYNYSVTTDDPNIVTSPIGKTKSIQGKSTPSLEFIVEVNSCDFKELLNAYKGGKYGIFFEMQDGSIEGWLDQAGTDIGFLKPFTALVEAFSKGAQEIDAVELFKVYLFFTVANQFTLFSLFKPAWGVDELLEAMPVGLTMEKTAAYATGDQNVQVNIRCDNGYVGLTDADFETSAEKSNVSTPAVTAVVDNGGGGYTLTVEKSVIPEPLAAGDIVSLRVKKLATLDVSHVSGWISIEGA